MNDPIVDRQYSDCRELLALWKAFSDFFSIGVKGEHLTPEKEGQFLQLKSRIAELHDSFMDSLTHDQNIGQGMLDVVSRSITLKHVNRLSTADVKKMEIEWHESYLLLNDAIGALEDKREELSKLSAAQVRAKKTGAAAQQKVTNFFTSAGFKLLMIVAAVGFATVGVQMTGVWDWDNAGQWGWAQVPYRWGKALVRKTYNPDSEWVKIDNFPRDPYQSWPAGLKEPTVKSTNLQDLMKDLPPNLPPVIRENLSKGTEYRKEETSKQFRGEVYIHSVLLPKTSLAKEASEAFTTAANTPVSGKELLKSFRLFNDHNLVTVIIGNNPDLVGDVFLGVYEQPNIY